jgi:hypothetical protein
VIDAKIHGTQSGNEGKKRGRPAKHASMELGDWETMQEVLKSGSLH